MAKFPNLQIKMKKEIESVIGDRTPVHNDRTDCHFVNAFISECLRYRNIVPLGGIRRASCDTKIGI
jgi:cytochrome P450